MCDQIVEVTDSIVSLYMHMYTLCLLVCAVLFIICCWYTRAMLVSKNCIDVNLKTRGSKNLTGVWIGSVTQFLWLHRFSICSILLFSGLIGWCCIWQVCSLICTKSMSSSVRSGLDLGFCCSILQSWWSEYYWRCMRGVLFIACVLQDVNRLQQISS